MDIGDSQHCSITSNNRKHLKKNKLLVILFPIKLYDRNSVLKKKTKKRACVRVRFRRFQYVNVLKFLQSHFHEKLLKKIEKELDGIMDVKFVYANIPNLEGISAMKKVKQCSNKDNNNINITNRLRDGISLFSHFYKHVVG